MHHITDLGCLLSGLAVSACRLSPASVISDMDAPMRSLGGRTVPDGAVGIYHLLIQCSPAEFLWSSLDGVGWCFFVGPFILPL